MTEDILLQMLEPKGEGDDTTGFREKVENLNGTTTTIFVVKEDGQYKMLDTLDAPIPSRLKCSTASRQAI